MMGTPQDGVPSFKKIPVEAYGCAGMETRETWEICETSKL